MQLKLDPGYSFVCNVDHAIKSVSAIPEELQFDNQVKNTMSIVALKVRTSRDMCIQ